MASAGLSGAGWIFTSGVRIEADAANQEGDDRVVTLQAGGLEICADGVVAETGRVAGKRNAASLAARSRDVQSRPGSRLAGGARIDV